MKMIILILNLLPAFLCFKVPEIDTREFIIRNIHHNFFDFPQVRSSAQNWLILNTPEDLLWKTRCYDRNCDNGGICERYTSLKFMKYTHKCICNSPWTGQLSSIYNFSHRVTEFFRVVLPHQGFMRGKNVLQW